MKILVLSSRFPWPADTGGKLRIFHLVRCLAERHQVTFLLLPVRERCARETRRVGRARTGPRSGRPAAAGAAGAHEREMEKRGDAGPDS